jgi:hypothetical protein
MAVAFGVSREGLPQNPTARADAVKNAVALANAAADALGLQDPESVEELTKEVAALKEKSAAPAPEPQRGGLVNPSGKGNR